MLLVLSCITNAFYCGYSEDKERRVIAIFFSMEKKVIDFMIACGCYSILDSGHAEYFSLPVTYFADVNAKTAVLLFSSTNAILGRNFRVKGLLKSY